MKRPQPAPSLGLFGTAPQPPAGNPGDQICIVCKSRRAWFGRRIKRDEYRWACAQHRAELDTLNP